MKQNALLILVVAAVQTLGAATYQCTNTLGSGSAPAKSGASYVWTGSEMLVWGGTNSGGYWNTTYGYTPGRTTYLYLRP